MEIADAGELVVDTASELISLAEANCEAMQIFERAYVARYEVLSAVKININVQDYVD